MRLGKKCGCSLFGGITALLSLTGAASAASIGVQFTGGTGNGTNGPVALTSGQVAGVVPQGNYNIAGGNNATAAPLNDSAGAATAAALTFSTAGNGYTSSPNAPSSPDEILNNGIINGTTGATPTVTITGIPYATYDLIVYELDDAQRIQRTTVGSTSFTSQSPGGNSAGYQDSNPSTPYTYIQGTDNTGTPVVNSDYVRFTGLTGSSVTFTVDARAATFPSNGNDNAFVNGFQIVQTPEPASIGLIALAGLGLLARRRRLDQPR